MAEIPTPSSFSVSVSVSTSITVFPSCIAELPTPSSFSVSVSVSTSITVFSSLANSFSHDSCSVWQSYLPLVRFPSLFPSRPLSLYFPPLLTPSAMIPVSGMAELPTPSSFSVSVSVSTSMTVFSSLANSFRHDSPSCMAELPTPSLFSVWQSYLPLVCFLYGRVTYP